MIRLATTLLALLTSPVIASETCKSLAKPVISLGFESRYADGDGSRSEIDLNRLRNAEQALEPLDAFITDLSDISDQLYSGSVDEKLRAANCLMDQFGYWVAADPLSQLETDIARMTIGSRFAALALILWQAQAYAPDHPARQSTLKWLERRMDKQKVFWQWAPTGARSGNLRAWAALAAAATSVQTGREDLRDWAANSFQDVACTANQDGSLPQEMKRGALALHYQLHAVAPLVTTAALLERQGIMASERCDGALHRIADFALQELNGGRRTEQITGKPQSLFNGNDQLEAFQLAWVEAYLHLKPQNQIEKAIAPLRPLIYSKLGGNQTALWGN